LARDSERIIEYMDKLFICGVRLGTLSVKDKGQFLRELFVGDRKVAPAGTDVIPAAAPLDPAEGEGNRGPAEGYAIAETPEVPETETAVQADWVGLDREEEQLITIAMQTWGEATPRKMTIFYYRYLLCKNILIGKYGIAGRVNGWMDRESVGALLNLLRYLSETHEADRIGGELVKLRDGGTVPSLPGLKVLKNRQREDYELLLETLELVVAY
jgi:hypothetical protein